MSAQLIYDLVPLGSIVRYSDGTPRPPERFRKKLAAWENRNSVAKQATPSRSRPLRRSTECRSPNDSQSAAQHEETREK